MLANLFGYFSLHCVGFAGGCLPVGKDRSIETFNNAVDHRCSRVVVDLLLSGVGIEYFIEREFRVFRASIFIGFEILDGNGLLIEQLVDNAVS